MSRRLDAADAATRLLPEQGENIRAELERVLSSHHFRASARCQHLLRHITEKTLAGETASLKERILGVEVFGRPPDYDTGQDPVVRATAAEIRKKLAQYYQEAEHTSEFRVDLHPGSYVAFFHSGKVTATATEPRRPRIAVVVLGAALVVLALVWGFTRLFAKHSPLDSFWSPLVASQGSILVSVGQPIAYNLKSFQAQDAIQGIGTPPPEFAAQDAIPKEDLVILPDRFVALGDATCLAHLISVFERYGKQYKVRGERTISFADLRETPAVLIGAFDNQWTQRLAGQLRFTFVKGAAPETDLVRDRNHPENAQWKLTGAWPYWDVANDYAIVTRVLDTTTNRPVVIAAGITQYGTMAAGELLSDPEYFTEAATQFPRGWERKNLQIVLFVPVVHHVPGRARVLTAHTW